MKKILVLLVVILLMFPIASVQVYASETEQEITQEQAPSEDLQVEEQPSDETLNEGSINLQEAKEVIKQIIETIIAAVVGALGGLSVTIIAKAVLTNLVTKVNNGNSDIEATKKETIEALKEVKNSADSVLATVQESAKANTEDIKQLKQELIEENQKSNAELKADIELIKLALPRIAGGMNELVFNGIAESVYELLNSEGDNNEEGKAL